MAGMLAQQAVPVHGYAENRFFIIYYYISFIDYFRLFISDIIIILLRGLSFLIFIFY